MENLDQDMEDIFEKYNMEDIEKHFEHLRELLRNKQALNGTRGLQERILGQRISLEVLKSESRERHIMMTIALKKAKDKMNKEESLWCIMKTRHRKTPYSMFCCYAPLDDDNYKTNPKFVFVGTHEECVRKLEELNTENT